MSRSYQHEIPKSRVNITLDVETGGSQSKKELPMKLLMLGDFSQGQSTAPLAQRERISVTKHNLNQVLNTISPTLNLTVPHSMEEGKEQVIPLTFQDMADFKPEQLVERVPQLKRLMAMRNLLKDLKSCVMDNQAFRKSLEGLLKDAAGSKDLLTVLSDKAPLIEN